VIVLTHFKAPLAGIKCWNLENLVVSLLTELFTKHARDKGNITSEIEFDNVRKIVSLECNWPVECKTTYGEENVVSITQKDRIDWKEWKRERAPGERESGNFSRRKFRG